MGNEAILINYQTRKEFCHCCERVITDGEMSKVKTFELSIKRLTSSMNWKKYVEHEEDLPETVRGYVFDIIEYYAVGSGERLYIAKGEIEKVMQFILDNFKK